MLRQRIISYLVRPFADESEVIAHLPEKVHRVIHSRLARLTPRAHELASLAAVVGRSFCFFVLQNASGVSETDLVSGLDELIHRRILLDRDPDAYDFSHDRIRDVAYAEISNVRRRILHDRVAQSMLKVFEDDLDSVSGQIAEHFVRADRKQEAIQYLIHAGDRSATQYANKEANGYFDRALELLQDDQLELRHSLLMRKLDIARLTKEIEGRVRDHGRSGAHHSTAGAGNCYLASPSQTRHPSY